MSRPEHPHFPMHRSAVLQHIQTAHSVHTDHASRARAHPRCSLALSCSLSPSSLSLSVCLSFSLFSATLTFFLSRSIFHLHPSPPPSYHHRAGTRKPKVMHVGRRLVYTHRKYEGIFNCPPDLRNFPFDIQNLKVTFQLKKKQFADRGMLIL